MVYTPLAMIFFTFFARVHYTGFWQEYYATKFGCNDIPKDTILALFYNIARYDKDGPVWSRKLDADAQRIVEIIFKGMAYVYLRLHLPKIYKMSTFEVSSFQPWKYIVHCSF